MKRIALSFGLAALATTAFAQSVVVGIDVRNNVSFTTETDRFVDGFTQLAQETRNLFAIDFDASSDTLYGIDYDSLEVVTIDTTTGISTATGTTIAGAGIAGIGGLTASSDGVTWYLCSYDGADTKLFRGDLATGVFTEVGVIAAGDVMIDISIDANDALYGIQLGTDALYSIDTTTGVATAVGPLGVNISYAQGMDFDPLTGELYAATYIGGGMGRFCRLSLVTGAAEVLETTTVLNAEMEIAIQASDVGVAYCAANANSTGVPAQLEGFGSAVALDNQLTLVATDLPTNSFGFFLASTAQGFVVSPGGSSGNLCLSGSIGRYVGPGEIQNSGASGSFSLLLDLSTMPTPTGPVAAVAGDTWSFQAWYRDTSVAGPTSNFTRGLEVVME